MKLKKRQLYLQLLERKYVQYRTEPQTKAKSRHFILSSYKINFEKNHKRFIYSKKNVNLKWKTVFCYFNTIF